MTRMVRTFEQGLYVAIGERNDVMYALVRVS